MSKECKCSMRIKLVGDGCDVCNPAQALEYARQTIEDQAAEIERLTKLNGELLAMLDRCVPHINPKVIDKSMMKYAPIDECYLNTLAASLVASAKGQP